MLRRLVEQQSSDSADRRLSELFSSAAPFEDDDPFRKRRIWVRLERQFKLPRHAGRFWARPLVVAALLISGTAMAELGQRYVLHGSGFLGLGGSPRATSANAALATRTRNAPKPVMRTAPPVPDPAAALNSALPVASIPIAVPTPEPVNARPTSKSARPRPEASEDATRVVEAIRALRTERNPARAQSLLNDYLKSNPRGTLSGDALALSIEAASAQHDPRAAEYARRYLATYPKGKYSDLAKRALQSQR